jgi:hypothetical protein
MTTVDTWLAAAVADAERRGLPELKPLLITLARSTAALRRADAALRAAGTTPAGPPAAP